MEFFSFTTQNNIHMITIQKQSCNEYGVGFDDNCIIRKLDENSDAMAKLRINDVIIGLDHLRRPTIEILKNHAAQKSTIMLHIYRTTLFYI